MDRSTFANYAEARESAYEGFVIPTQRLFASDLKTQLLPECSSNKGLKIEPHNRGVQVLQEYENKKSLRRETMVKKGVATREEATSALGLPAETQTDTAAASKGTPILGYHIDSGTVSRNEARQQLGLPPERATWVLTSNRWPAFMAIRMAASTLVKHPKGFDGPSDDLLAMFLFFDPAALNPLTLHLPPSVLPDMDEAANSFFYGGIGVVRENLVKWTSGSVPRLSLINLTAMIDLVACSPYENESDDHAQYRLAFFRQLEAEAGEVIERWGTEPESYHIWGVLERDGAVEPSLLAQRLGIRKETAAKSVADFEDRARRDCS